MPFELKLLLFCSHYSPKKGAFYVYSRIKRRGESLPAIFNDFLMPWDKWFDTNGGSLAHMLTVPAVNIVEKQNHFEISSASPGMKKDDFQIDVEGNMLTISAFNYSSFSRTFTLPEGVMKDRIEASYNNGLLTLMLPKTEEAKKTASKHIPVK